MKHVSIVLLPMLGILITACSTHGPPANIDPRNPTSARYPNWVIEGSGPMVFASGRAFVGVGSVTGIRNSALARTTADNRARAEVAKQLEIFSATLMQSYHRGSTPARPRGPGNGSYPRPAPLGVVVVEHWTHPDGTTYALAILDLESTRRSVSPRPPRVSAFWRQHAAAVHDQLAAAY